MSFIQASGLLACRRETAALTMLFACQHNLFYPEDVSHLVHWFYNPIDAGIATDGNVLWVNEDHLKVLVS